MFSVNNFVLQFVVLLNIHTSFTTEVAQPNSLREEKAVYKSGEEIRDLPPITLDSIKSKLKQSGIFDYDRTDLTASERKEAKKLFDVVEIMTTSRNRQPGNVQTMFTSLRIVERILKKQMKEGQISESLADKFDWDKIKRKERAEPYHLDETTNMRVFNVN